MADTQEKANIIHEESLKSETADTSGNVTLVDAAGRIRRIPIPSSDPNDPLSLSKWRKMGVVVTCCLYSIFSLTLVGGAGPILPSWIALYAPQGIGVQKVVNLTTYPSLIMAFGESKTLFIATEPPTVSRTAWLRQFAFQALSLCFRSRCCSGDDLC